MVGATTGGDLGEAVAVQLDSSSGDLIVAVGEPGSDQVRILKVSLIGPLSLCLTLCLCLTVTHTISHSHTVALPLCRSHCLILTLTVASTAPTCSAMCA